MNNLSNIFKSKTLEIPHEGDLSEVLMDTLNDFDVDAKVVGVLNGPVITRYMIEPARGTRVKQFTNLNTEISMETGGLPVNMEIPVIGTRNIGIDIPNKTRSTIPIGTIVNKIGDDKILPLAIGCTTDGSVVIEDLAAAPHLLIAGQTGSGKSVAMNSIILGLMAAHTPETLEFVMIDPKVVELSMYANIPYLKMPIISDMNKAITALKAVVNEMEMRYHLIASKKVRNIASYNKIATKKLPYTVVVIDELSDLMMTNGKDVESLIVRIAQKARAVGIHLVVATQRPSVDVITGLMKSNIPARISFKVASNTDSRIILDESGAENLLGKGDMYVKMGAHMYRAHGAWVSDTDVIDAVNHIKNMKNNKFDIITECYEALGRDAENITGINKDFSVFYM